MPPGGVVHRSESVRVTLALPGEAHESDDVSYIGHQRVRARQLVASDGTLTFGVRFLPASWRGYDAVFDFLASPVELDDVVVRSSTFVACGENLGREIVFAVVKEMPDTGTTSATELGIRRTFVTENGLFSILVMGPVEESFVDTARAYLDSVRWM